MNYIYTTRGVFTVLLCLSFTGVVFAQEGAEKTEDVPIVEQINIRDVVKKGAQNNDNVGVSMQKSTLEDIQQREKSLNHDASRSNNTNSKIDTSDIQDSGDQGAIQRDRKRPGRVIYGEITLTRSFNTNSPYPNETQEIEAVKKAFLFGVLPMQVPVVAQVSKDDEIFL